MLIKNLLPLYGKIGYPEDKKIRDKDLKEFVNYIHVNLKHIVVKVYK